MEYAASQPFHGNIDKSLDLAVAALSALGFRLDARTPDSAKLSGPGMNNSRQCPLVGASRLDIRAERGQLALFAELGGVERMSRFVRYFPISLNLGLGVIFLTVFGLTIGRRLPFATWAGPVIGVTLLNGAIWAVLGPWMARKIHQRTCQGLETLLTTLVTAGQDESTPP
jgi:hypothetical protein